MSNDGFRRLPSIDRILSHPRAKELVSIYSHEAIADIARGHLDEARKTISEGGASPSLEEVVEAIDKEANYMWRSRPSRVINATGVIIHTNLGRAPLSKEAAQAVQEVALNYSDLEMDLETGERSSRDTAVQTLLCQLTGAEAALAVNNNAAAVLLGLAALAKDREVIVSRGEAVEIGGGFRIPDVIRQSGTRLVEVGTTNRTYVSDFEGAITEDTAALLRVHASNFKVSGFTHSPTIEEMVALGQRRNVVVLHDVGSGCLLDTSQFGLAPEPTPQASIAAGAEMVFFSGDKLLGGPQAGIIVGKNELIDRVKKHPMARALRIDKLTLAALNATLVHYIKEEALSKVPVWVMLTMPIQEIEARAHSWQQNIGGKANIVDGFSTIGGGSLPGEILLSKPLAISPSADSSVDDLSKRLRRGDPPVIGRIDKDKLLLDPRTVQPEDDDALVSALKSTLTSASV